MISKVKIILIAVMFISVVCPGCYAGITGKVIDAETQQPVEGAVVLVEWTKTKGVPGMAATESYKVIEMLSDKEGKVTISGVLDPWVNPPHITVYKKGYVAWNNEFIFPDYKKRTDFKWENEQIIKLYSFRKEYLRKDHVFFLHSMTHWGKLINEAYRWEELEGERLR
ncbi:MAG: carboxypeptidase-like regulatory domain-containing protein [Nitrospirae bacterium]|nr:carboxypeptidase-like regulatory domain-containing protein [Nitrospirota bacterium]